MRRGWKAAPRVAVRETIDLVAIVHEVVEDAAFEPRAVARRAAHRDLRRRSSAAIPELLRSAVENVVRNAVRHTREGTAVE